MKIELEQNNKVFVFEGPNRLELHPIWLRERVSEKEHLDKNTEQRLFDPSLLKDIKINKVNITDKLLDCLLYTSPSPRDATLSRMPSSA